MNSIPLAMLLVFSGLTMNILLQLGLGARGIVISDQNMKTVFSKLGTIFLTVILLWMILVKFISFFSGNLVVYILLFPLASITYESLEFLICRFIIKKKAESKKQPDFCNGITAAALFVCLNLANGFLEAVVLSFGFVSGILLSVLILNEIRKKAILESVPVFLRGIPLTLISMGLLSLVFTQAALMLFRISGIR